MVLPSAALTRAAGLPGFGAPRAWGVAFGLPVVLARLAGWRGEVPRSGRHISRHVHNAHPVSGVEWHSETLQLGLTTQLSETEAHPSWPPA
eukprot:COSAG06_NODE_30268_length_541_cov_6.420814_1_plen_90_part_01